MTTAFLSLRRSLIVTLALGLLTVHGFTQAQGTKFPDKPVKLVVTYPPGGSSDLMARIMGQKMSEIWGQPVIIESRPGAAGSIGMEYAARQPADGYTFAVVFDTHGVNQSLMPNMPYDSKRDLTPLILVGT